MSPFKLLLVMTTLSFTLAVDANDEERAAKQAELDAACEAARSKQLVPLRRKMANLCIEKEEFESQEECETYYADYGERAGGRPAMFYDLPACVTAFDYAQSERSGG